MNANQPIPSTPSRKFGQYAEYVIVAVLLLIAAVLAMSFFERIPIEGTSLAIDWKGILPGLKGGQITYAPLSSLYIAPWDALLMAPLGFFSLGSSWGLLMLITTAILVVSVPSRAGKSIQWLTIFVLVTSWPAIRNTVDGNFEGLVVAGAALIVYGYRKQNPWWLGVGVLLATAKPQETWLLILVVSIFIVRGWAPRQWLRSGLVITVVALPTFLWLGGAWLGAIQSLFPPPGSLMDSSLSAALGRMGIGTWFTVAAGRGILIGISAYVLWVGTRALSREKAAMLICLSQLVAPYIAGNSYLTVVAIGIIPFLQSHWRLGLVLIILTDLPYLLSHDFLYYSGAYYTTGLLLLTWGIFCWQTYMSERKQRSPAQPGGDLQTAVPLAP